MRSREIMCKFVVIIEKREVQFLRWLMISHHNDSFEFILTLFQKIDLFYFFTIFVLVFRFEIQIAIVVDVIQYSANFSETRQDLTHQQLRLFKLSFLYFPSIVLQNLFASILFIFIFKLQVPTLHENLAPR